MRSFKPLSTAVLAAAFFLSCFLLFTGLSAAQEQHISQEQCVWNGVERIVVVGDLHGAYEEFIKILEGTDLIDSGLRWTGGESHLVQVGDVLDRGDKARAIFDLLMRLESEAAEAGGWVHFLLGNHEEMNLSDTAFDHEGYITPSQFSSFVGRSYMKKQERIFRRQTAEQKRKDDPETIELSTYLQSVIDRARMNSLHRGRRSYFNNLSRNYGDWILSHNVAVKINDIVFVHAGITRFFSNWDLKKLNDRYRLELEDVRKAIRTQRMPTIPEYEREIYNNPNGPLWARDLVINDEAGYAGEVDRILENLQAEHIVIGHSPVYSHDERGMKRYGGKVWIVDTGISEFFTWRGGFLSALIIEKGRFRVWTSDSGGPVLGIPGLHGRHCGQPGLGKRIGPPAVLAGSLESEGKHLGLIL